LLVALLAGTTRFAQADDKGRAEQTTRSPVGAWRLISIQNVRADGLVDTSWEGIAKWMGPHPVGLLVYDASGWMSVQFGRDPRQEWTVTSVQTATPEDKAKAFEAFYSYFGRYEVDEKAGVVMHHIERSLWPVESGITMKRFFKIDGNRLTIATAPLPNGSHNVLVWERVGAR
jgi:hypothetical protein